MKRQTRKTRPTRHDAVAQDRKGSTLLIVLALLGLLTLLGLLFFTFANQERTSAEYFTEASKREPEQSDDGVIYAVEQLLLGSSQYRRNSVLYGRAGIVQDLTGSDSRPGNGSGVNIIYFDPTGTGAQRIPVVDQNRDGQPDVWPDNRASINQLINIVDSQSAHMGQYRDTSAMPSPDTGTTYVDLSLIHI